MVFGDKPKPITGAADNAAPPESECLRNFLLEFLEGSFMIVEYGLNNKIGNSCG